ncbi:hypothetical protein GCM10022209_14930 [Chitinophaga oryziterrae]
MRHEVQRQLLTKPSIEEAKQIPQADQYAYTDKEITIIINFIDRLAATELNIYEQLRYRRKRHTFSVDENITFQPVLPALEGAAIR